MEAIVILILAVVMLGLGLTFVRTMFSNITDKAKNAIDVADLSAKPSEGEPVVFSPNNPEIKEGKQINVQVGFYNPSTSADNWMMKVIDSSYDDGVCGGMSDPDVFCGDSGTALQTIYNDKPFKLSKMNKLDGISFLIQHLVLKIKHTQQNLFFLQFNFVQ